ncbi:MAG: hypothetical protein IM613_12085 [Cytophagales bacterium]|jgi:hypothetical protein|nr:hypothetical protein [Cytophagales bacterium]
MKIETIADLQAICQGFDSDPSFRGFLLHPEQDAHNYSLGDGVSFEVVEVGSDCDYNQETTILLVFEFTFPTQKARIGLYVDGANTVVDYLDVEGTLVSWAESFDKEYIPELLHNYCHD